MSTVGALVSAFYCVEYLPGRIENLLGQTIVPEILAVCLRGSEEETYLRSLHEDAVKIIPTSVVPSIYGAWNKAIDVAEVDYLVTANADDLFYFWAIERMQSLLDFNSKVAVVYPNSDVSIEYQGMPVGRYEWQDFDQSTMMSKCYIGPMPMWRRRLHDKYGPFDSQMLVAGDYEFWLRVATQGEEFLHLPEAVGCYLSRPDSREHREPVRTLWETARARSRYTKEAYGPEISPHSEAGSDASDHSLPDSRREGTTTVG